MSLIKLAEAKWRQAFKRMIKDGNVDHDFVKKMRDNVTHVSPNEIHILDKLDSTPFAMFKYRPLKKYIHIVNKKNKFNKRSELKKMIHEMPL